MPGRLSRDSRSYHHDKDLRGERGRGAPAAPWRHRRSLPGLAAALADGKTAGFTCANSRASMLAVGGLSPLLGGLLQKMSVRSAMIGGAALSAVAYLGLAVLPSFGLALLMFGFIGTGVSILAVLGPLTLIKRWFASDQAKVLSIVNLPIALFVTPFTVAELLPEYGRFAILGGIATIFLLLICVLMLIVEDPGRIGQAPRGINLASRGSAHDAVRDQARHALCPARCAKFRISIWFFAGLDDHRRTTCDAVDRRSTVVERREHGHHVLRERQ